MSSVKTTTILFHQISLRNMIEGSQKADLLQYIDDKCHCKILDDIYEPYQKNTVKFQENGPVLIQTITNGKKYWMFITDRFSSKYEIFLIEKFLKRQYPTPKILVITEFFEGFSENTEILFECELIDLKFSVNELLHQEEQINHKNDENSKLIEKDIKNSSEPLLLLLSDILLVNGESFRRTNPLKRMVYIHKFWENAKMIREQEMTLQIKKLFTRDNSIWISNFCRKQSYKIIGLVFYFCKKTDDKDYYETPMFFYDRRNCLYRVIKFTKKKHENHQKNFKSINNKENQILSKNLYFKK